MCDWSGDKAIEKTFLRVLGSSEFSHRLGQQRTCRPRNPPSVLPPRPDIADQAGHVGLVPRPDTDLARATTKTICLFPKNLDHLVQSIGSLQMIISSQIFHPYLECPTKCWLRSPPHPITRNLYPA